MIHKEKVIDLCFSNVFPCTYETNKQRNDSKKRTKKVRSIYTGLCEISSYTHCKEVWEKGVQNPS